MINYIHVHVLTSLNIQLIFKQQAIMNKQHLVIGIFTMFLSWCLIPFHIQAQTNFTLRDRFTYNHSNGEDGSDIWGFERGGSEYAIATTSTGFSIIDVTNPDNVQELIYIPGVNTFWREGRIWGNYVYVVNDAAGGMVILDISDLPNGSLNASDVTIWSGNNWQGNFFSYERAHNIFIDENGIGYLLGYGGFGGAIMIDIAANPTNPPIVGFYTERYIHDAFVRNDTMWAAEINNGVFSVVDVSNKTNPIVLGTRSSSSNFTHNIWVSDNGQYAFTTDETGGAYIDAYDVSDVNNMQRIGQYRSNPGSNVVPHNVFVHGNFLLVSYYQDGVIMLDATHPELMIEVGNYDTSPGSGGGTNGCWGVHGYLPSGTVLANDIGEGLFVLTPNYQAAAFLEGLVINQFTGNPITGATITVQGNGDMNTISDASGNFLAGNANGGSYTITVTATGYDPVTITVNLVNGQTIFEQINLLPEGSTALTITKEATSTVAVGGTITYTLTIANNTGGTLNNVTVTDNLPAQTTYVNGSATCGSVSNGTLTIPIGTMANGASQNCSFQVTVDANGNFDGATLSDDMESGAGNWTTSNGVGNRNWELLNDAGNARSGSGVWFANNVDFSTDQYLVTAQTITLSDDANMRFWHKYNTEQDWDGGVIEISTNGGNSWTDLGNNITQNAYDGPVNQNQESAISGRSAFHGNSNGYIETVVDLSPYAGNDAFIRFRLATDGFVEAEGWYIDDVTINSLPTITNVAFVTASGNWSDNDAATTIVTAPICNNPPSTANAGTNQELCGENTAMLTANNPAVGTGAWSLVSGMGNIQSPNSRTTTVTNLGTGNNVFAWTITNETCPPSSDQVSITIHPNIQVSISGNSTQSVCVGESIPLRALTAASNPSFSWSPTTGLNNPNIANPTFSATTANGNGQVYTVTVTDENDCEATAAVTIISEECGIQMNLKVLLAGAFNTNSQLMDAKLKNNAVLIPTQQPFQQAPWNYTGQEQVSSTNDFATDLVDWVLVEVRAQNQQTIVARKAAWLLTNGNVVEPSSTASILRFPNLDNNETYSIIIRHRNHLAIMTANPVTVSNNVLTVDFTVPQNVLGGTRQLTALQNGLYGLIAGDFNSDGVINVTDFNFFIAEIGKTNEYVASDVDLNRSVTVADFNLYQESASVIGVAAVRY